MRFYLSATLSLRVTAWGLHLHKWTPSVPNSTQLVYVLACHFHAKHHLWLMMLLLGTCTSLGRFILSDIKPWNRAIWGARWDSNPRPRRGWTFILYQLSYLRWLINNLTNLKTWVKKWLYLSLVETGSSKLQKTSAIYRMKIRWLKHYKT